MLICASIGIVFLVANGENFCRDLALDHLLQVLFVLNHVCFPSRKRSASHIEMFGLKPVPCEKRLEGVVRLRWKCTCYRRG